MDEEQRLWARGARGGGAGQVYGRYASKCGHGRALGGRSLRVGTREGPGAACRLARGGGRHGGERLRTVYPLVEESLGLDLPCIKAVIGWRAA